LAKIEDCLQLLCGGIFRHRATWFATRGSSIPVIGHPKNEHRMQRNYLHHRHGDANNAILAAVGYNFRLLIKWLRILLCLVMAAILARPKSATA